MSQEKYCMEKRFTSFCDLFEVQCRKGPRQIAARFKERVLTYEELNYQSSIIANYIKANTKQPEAIVALSLHNSLDLLAATMGILKSGCAYLPIDPSYPTERVKSIFQDAKPALFLTEESLSNQFSFLPCQIHLINQIHCSVLENSKELIQGNQLAYIIYTSGSSGKPKGIMIEHSALSQAVAAYQHLLRYPLISLSTGSISFDISVLVMSHTLASGGTLCISENEIANDPRALIALIESNRVNYVVCVPSLYRKLLDQSVNLPSLKSVIVGGDNLSQTLPEQHAKLASNADLYNVYGPCEYAIGATLAKIYDPLSKHINKVSIGKPLPNTQVYILNENMQECPAGTKGEIYISGDGLARGYLNNEKLSAEKFLWPHSQNTPPVRLYRTGDYGLILADGNIEFLGRIDHQVKIRGFRIELGEIEFFLCQHPDVNEAIVLTQERNDDEKQLIAYFSSNNSSLQSQLILEYLKNGLPHFMIPSALIKVKEWPLTPNGKIDRAALRNCSASVIAKNRLVDSLSNLQKQLFVLWNEVLKHDQFGIGDNFFDVGGDSLQAVELQTLLNTQLGYNLSIGDIFQHPSIESLASYLTSSNNDIKSLHDDLAKKQRCAFQKFKKLSLYTQTSSKI